MTPSSVTSVADYPDPVAASAAMATNRPLARSAFHLVLGQAATTGLAVVLTGVIGRSLGPSDFGVWYLLNMLAGFAYVFVDWGYAAYIIREVARRPDRAGELTGTSLSLRAVAAVLISGPAVISTWLLGYPSRMHALTLLMMTAWLPMLLLTSFSWTFRGRERMDFEALVNVVLKTTALGLTWSLLALGVGIPGIIIAQGLAGSVAFACAMRLYGRLHLSALRANLRTARELIREAAPMFAMALPISFQPYIDANMLSRLAPPQTVGWYGAAATISATLLAPAIILGGTFYPRLSRVTHNRGEFDRLVRTGLQAILFLAMLGALGSYLFADFAVQVVYRKAEFGPAGNVLQAFAPLLFLASVDIFLGTALFATGRIASFARAKVVAVILTTLFEFFLIPICQTRFGNGGLGVMLSLAGGELVMIAAAFHLLPRGTLDRRAILDFARAFVAGLVALFVIRRLGPASPLAAIPLTVAAYTCLSVALGLVRRGDILALAGLVTLRKPNAVSAVVPVTR
jgi:O-antigen/teichoic acid export membrane protein